MRSDPRTTETGETVRVSLSRDPGRDSNFDAKSDLEAADSVRDLITSKFYAITETTEVVVTAQKRELARTTVTPRKG